jgi:hypothetical protein
LAAPAAQIVAANCRVNSHVVPPPAARLIPQNRW